MRFLRPLQIVYAHCDIPCGIYDPHNAQVAALTVIRMMDLIDKSKNDHDTARYIHTKEKHAEECKHEIRVIWGDYFKEEHFTKYSDLNEITHSIMQLASKARQGVDRAIAVELLEAVNKFAEIFWETEDVKTKRVVSPYEPKGNIVYPIL